MYTLYFLPFLQEIATVTAAWVVPNNGNMLAMGAGIVANLPSRLAWVGAKYLGFVWSFCRQPFIVGRTIILTTDDMDNCYSAITQLPLKQRYGIPMT